MHTVVMSEGILARTRLTRCERDHLFDKLDMARTAHVVVDMQLGFAAEGAPMEVPFAREIIGNVNAISRAVCAGGGTNVFLRFAYDPDEPVEWRMFYEGYGHEN